MASDSQQPGVFNVSVVQGDPYVRSFQFNQSGEAMALPAEDWRAQIRKTRAGEVVAEWEIDATDTGLVELTLPALGAGRYAYDLECVGVRTFLQGTITVKLDVSRDDD